MYFSDGCLHKNANKIAVAGAGLPKSTAQPCRLVLCELALREVPPFPPAVQGWTLEGSKPDVFSAPTPSLGHIHGPEQY